jgi:hypothetical protein
MTLTPPAEHGLMPGQPGPCRFCKTLMPWDARHGYWLCPTCHAAQFPPDADGAVAPGSEGA